MKYIFRLMLILLAGVAIHAQINCPEIKVIGPSALTQAGDTIDFSVEIKGIATGKLNYEWTVSLGNIYSGQSTPNLIVQTTKEMYASNITATVKVTSLPPGCADSASETAAIMDRVGCGRPMDEFGLLKKTDMIARLDSFYIELQNNPDATGHIRVSFSKKDSLKFREKYLSDLINAFTFLKKDPSRVSFAVYEWEYEDVNTKLWLVPLGADLSDIGDDKGRLVYGNDFKKNIKTILQNL